MAKKKAIVYVFEGEVYTKEDGLRITISYKFDQLKNELSIGESDTVQVAEEILRLAKLYNDQSPLAQEVTIDV